MIKAEVANTFQSRMVGMMLRESMGANEGMLFVFPDITRHCMWMRNTLVPLSVAFIDEDGTIFNIEEMKPRTEESHCSAKPARYALEMPAGWFKTRSIKAGSKIVGLEKAGPPQ